MINKKPIVKIKSAQVFDALKAGLFREMSKLDWHNKPAGGLYNLRVAGLERTMKTGKLNKFSKEIIEKTIKVKKEQCNKAWRSLGAKNPLALVDVVKSEKEIKALQQFLRTKSKPVSK